MDGLDLSEAYVRFALDDQLSINDKPIVHDYGKNPKAGRRSGSARMFFGLLAFLLLAVILGFVAHYSSALSSWSRHKNLTSREVESKNLPDIKQATSNKTVVCSPGWVQVNRKCYYISPIGVTQTFQNSRQDCTDRGGRLVVIKSRSELHALGLFHLRAWIGLSKRGNRGKWLWVDGTELQDGFWLKGQPNGANRNEDCAGFTVIRKILGFNDNDCAREIPYICGTLE